MPARPEIFISATTKDLKSCRQLVSSALLTLGCVPVVEEHFPPDTGKVCAILREKIVACQAVIHLVGECYGREPQERAPDDPRRSYTQMEYDIARELKKSLYIFLCASDFPYDAHDPEPADLRALQDAHRVTLAAGDALCSPVRDPCELSERVRELQPRVESFARDLQKTRSWLGRGVAAAVAALLLVAVLIYGVKRQGEAGQRQAEQRAAQAEQQLADLKGQLQQQTKLITLVSEKLDRNSVGPDKADPAAAREATARELGISEQELEKQLADEKTDVRALLARVEQGSAAAEAKASEWRKLKRETLTKLGDAEYAAGHYAATVEPYRQALALADKDREPLVWCDMAQNLEIGLEQMGHLAEAEPLAREFVEKRTALQGAEHPDTLQSVINLANVLYAKGDYTGAEALYHHALEVYERRLGKEHPATLGSANNLAGVLYAKGDYTGAEVLYRRCLEAQERTLGKEHPDTLPSANNLAGVLYAKGDYTGAEKLFRRCLEAQERTLGKEHPATLGSVNNLAGVFYANGDLAEAETLYCRCLEARERTLGKEHPATLQSVNNLAAVLRDKRDLAGAEALFRRCLEAQERTLGKEHPDTLDSANNLAAVLDAKGDYTDAEALYRRCLEAQERTLGKEHPDTAMTAFNLSLLEIALGRLREALPLAEEAVAAAKASLPEDHPHRHDYEENLANLRVKLAAAPPPP